ncbi:MAG: phosphatidate cytidylyltransferase [Myxococcaceae bacterium]
MTDKNKNLVLRIVSAIVLLPIVVFLLYKGGYYAAALIGVAAALCTYEYYLIVQKKLSPAGIVGVIAAGVLPILPVAAPQSAMEAAFWTVGGMFIFSWAYHLIRGPLGEAPTLSAHLITGLIYGSLGLTAVSAIRNIHDGLWWVICTLAITWLNDTFAYFFGRFLGKRKLYPAVSPNKTWEGFFGGLLGSLVAMFVIRAVFFKHLSVQDCLALGVIGGTFGPVGDLCESMLKRAYGVKDSGKILPGHGGMLDRIDALIFNAPLVFVYIRFVKGWM